MPRAAREEAGLPLGERLLERLGAGALEIPPLPEVAQRLLALAGEDEADGAAIADLVHRDAALAAAILRLANSAALGGATEIVSLRQAVTRLGMRRVSECALSVCLRESVFVVAAHPALVQELWQQSLATALYAKEVARELRCNVEVAFLCGLMLRVGRPLALSQLPALEAEPGAKALDLDAARSLAVAAGSAFGAAAVAAWELPAAVRSLFAQTEEAEGAAEPHLTNLAERLAISALARHDDAAEAAEDSADAAAALEGDADACALNLYPESLEALVRKAPRVLEELDQMP